LPRKLQKIRLKQHKHNHSYFGYILKTGFLPGFFIAQHKKGRWMMKKMALISGLILSLALFGGQLAEAAPPGGYIGFSLGSADVKEIDESDSAYKLFGGWTANEYFGLEVAFVDLGSYPTFFGMADAYGVAFDVVGYLPLGNNFNLMGKLGIFSWTVDVDFLNATDDGTDLTYGLGVQYDFNNRFSIRGEWEEFTDVSGSDISLLSAGVLYTF
jgi:OOP family OmpA-OmpF porin